jgi:secreted PhoX family phosphatase
VIQEVEDTMKNKNANEQRRAFLQKSLLMAAAGATMPLINACSGSSRVSIDPSAGLMEADENGIMLPEGLKLKSRIVAHSGQQVAGTSYAWHGAPDGGACFAADDGGWVYVSNAELNGGDGGVGALRFDAQGQVVDAYSILANTNRNCAGGVMPWGTWMSCEESGDDGRVFECDPFNQVAAKEIPTLGRFNHEAVAYDTENHHIYLTEDKRDGGFYRFVPDKLSSAGYADLSSGQLQVAQVVTGASGESQVVWHVLSDPSGSTKATRDQVAEMTPFKGGEGVLYHENVIYFTTKHDNRVWAFDIESQQITTLYDYENSLTPILTGVDNIAVNRDGELLVAEDGGDMQIVLLNEKGEARPLLQIVGQSRSEICGPAFSPDGSRLYFSSQRGTSGFSSGGITYEISGFS